jgi:hypothetical protein
LRGLTPFPALDFPGAGCRNELPCGGMFQEPIHVRSCFQRIVRFLFSQDGAQKIGGWRLMSCYRRRRDNRRFTFRSRSHGLKNPVGIEVVEFGDLDALRAYIERDLHRAQHLVEVVPVNEAGFQFGRLAGRSEPPAKITYDENAKGLIGVLSHIALQANTGTGRSGKISRRST